MISKLAALSLTTIVVWLSVAIPDFAAERPTLKEVFRNDFRVGTAISTQQILGDEPAALSLSAKQFDTITPENVFKWQEIHPQPDEYNFDPADRFVEFGEKNGMFIIGHNLVWHSQTPAWVFESDSRKPLDRDTLLKRMRSHIRSVAGRYNGRISGWDVVNEAVEDDGSLRKSKWQQLIGDDYIEKAFQFAHEADSKAELYYNDYNEWKPEKIQGIKKLVERLKSKGIRIDGIGLQGHWGLDYPSTQEIENMFSEYGGLGIKLLVTELDVTVLPDASRAGGADIARRTKMRKELDPYRNGLPADVQQRLAERYAEIFRLFVKHADKIDRVTFWGVHDGDSWRNNWPIRGRCDYPLLFDRQLQPKIAFDWVVKAAGAR
jgi:endo-1,4-beta-xylanase